MKLLAPLFVAAVLGAGCAGRDFDRARRHEDKGEAAEAVRTYARFLERAPEDPRAPEARFRAARLYQEAIGDCGAAVPLFESAARSQVEPWAELSRGALIDCPDLFPLAEGAKWTYVDTLSGGENMRLEVRVTESSGGVRGTIEGAYYAGDERFQDYSRSYRKGDWSVWETADTGTSPMLRFPYRKGRSWTAVRNGQTVDFEVVADGLTVETKAGSFGGCVKVKQHVRQFPSWVFEYFCPDVGRVKTTVGVPGVENPNTELASYKIPEPSPAGPELQ